MADSPFSTRIFLLLIFVSLSGLLIIYLRFLFDTSTTIVFCDVGQGDATYMRIKNKIDVLIDAGPDNSVLQCLGRYMPFFDRTIELAFMTHPQKDHYFGFIEVEDRYRIKTIFMNPLDSTNDSFSILKGKIEKNGTDVFFPVAGTIINLSQVDFHFFWPNVQYLADHVSQYQPRFFYKNYSPKGIHADSLQNFLGTSALDPNLFSLIFTFEQKPIRILFTGDSTGIILNSLLEKNGLNSTILKVPHHGSRNGLTAEFLELASPSISVISVGKNNRYGHPSPEILSLFKTIKKKYLRTDLEGEFVFKIRDNMVERIK